MARGVSTVLDVAVCLLFVGAAVATLAGVPQSAETTPAPDAAETARELGTVTTGVPSGDGRRAHASLAGHLSAAAVSNASLEAAAVTRTDYPSAVANETESLTDERVFVTAQWEPYPGAPLVGRVGVGQRPPGSVDVAATRQRVDSGVSPPTRTDTFAALARSLADAYVHWLFPPERTYARLVDDRTAPSTTARYRSVADAFGTDVTEAVDDRRVRQANDALAVALADRLEADLRSRFEAPAAAASNATVEEVELVVRRWSP